MIKENKKIYVIKKQESKLSKTIRFLFEINICSAALVIIFLQEITKNPNIVLLIIYAILLSFLCINTYLFIRLVYLYRVKNNYDIKLKRIRLKYKKNLVHHKYNFSDRDYNKIYEFDSINKLISVSDKTSKKIYYFEVTPGEKCFFLLESNDNLYKYILNK